MNQQLLNILANLQFRAQQRQQRFIEQGAKGVITWIHDDQVDARETAQLIEKMYEEERKPQ